MKTTLSFLLVLITFSSLTYAQTSKGSFLLGGNFNIHVENSHYEQNNATPYIDEDITSFEVNPYVGYFLFNNLAIGFTPGYSYQKTITISQGNTTNFQIKRFQITPYVRYYGKISKQLSFFAQGTVFNLEHRTAKTTLENANVPTTESIDKNETLSPRIVVQPGLVFFATKRIGIEATLGFIGYSFERNKRVQTANGVQSEYIAVDKNFDISFNPARFSLGLQFYLGK
jgi:hypothetical protein